MISAFIWYAYCPCRWKIIIFQKSVCQKLKNLSVKLGHFGVNLRKNYGSYKVAQSFYRCAKIPSFIWDHVWTDLGRNLDHRSPKSLSGRFHPPSLYRSTGKPTLIRVKILSFCCMSKKYLEGCFFLYQILQTKHL